MKLFFSSDSRGVYAKKPRLVDSVRNDTENYKR